MTEKERTIRMEYSRKRQENKKGAEMAAHCPETGKGSPAPGCHIALRIKAGSMSIPFFSQSLSLSLSLCLPPVYFTLVLCILMKITDLVSPVSLRL